jgi:hypothetical protein
MGKMKNVFIDKINEQPDDIDWKSNQLDPAPDEVDLDAGKSMWIIKDYKIWAHSYKEALEMLPMIESF